MTRHHHRHLAVHLAVLAALSTVLPGASGPPGAAAAIEDLDREDVPSECAQTCAPVVQLTGRCEAAAEQQFGAAAVDRRWTGHRRAKAVVVGGGGLDREARRWRRGTGRSLQRMLGSRLGRRQNEDGSDSEDSEDSEDSDDDEEDGEGGMRTRPASGNDGGTGEGESFGGDGEADDDANEEAAGSAMRACVCGETGFDVAVAAFGCAACVSRNGTAVDADEDIRQIIAACGFIPATDPPVPTTTTTTATTPPPAVLAPALSTLPPLFLAPAEPSSAFSSATDPPPAPASPTSSTPLPSQVPADATRSRVSITPVTVFETPSFSALPPIVLPNDVSSSPPVLESENQMSGAARGPGGGGGTFNGWLRPGGVVCVVVVGLLWF